MDDSVTKLKVLLVDDQALVRTALAELIQAADQMEVVASTGNLQVGTATCPAGKKAVSGGAFPIFDGGLSGTVDLVAIHVSRPFTFTNPNDSWNVHLIESSPDNVTTWHVITYAVCVTVA